MRVVAGSARGRPLRAPAGRATRPTSDRVREAVFSVVGSLMDLEGAKGADLFAGSGALGIEALSRGAASVLFVDHDREAVAAIRANLASLDLGPGRAVVRCGDALALSGEAAGVDLLLADPPYAFTGWPTLLGRLVGDGFAGLAVLESDAEVDTGPGWRAVRVKRYGTTVVTVARPVTPALSTADVTAPSDAKGAM